MVLYCGDPLLKVVLSKYPLYRSSACNEISRRHSRLSSMLRILTANFRRRGPPVEPTSSTATRKLTVNDVGHFATVIHQSSLKF
jgi:hypothetical protein